MRVGFIVDEASYCSSKKRPAFEAVGVVRDFVVVRVSKTKAARDNLVDKGVDEKDSIDDRRCERIVVLPEPDSPRKTIAWSSPRPPNLDQALPARSSASPIALPSFPPSGPFADDV